MSFWRHYRDFHQFIYCISSYTYTNTEKLIIFPRTYMYLFTFTQKKNNNSAQQALETKLSLLYDVSNYLPTKKCCTFKYPEM